MHKSPDVGGSEIASDLLHPVFVRVRGNTGNCYSPGFQLDDNASDPVITPAGVLARELHYARPVIRVVRPAMPGQ
jgi:hypothetical protein